MAGMLKLSETVTIAIHSMIILTLNKDKLNSVKLIAEILDASESYLSKILQQLVKAGYVSSIRGPKGGFILKENAENTRLIDIYKLFEGVIEINSCGFKGESCNELCSLNNFIDSIDNQLINYFQATSIKDIIISHNS